MTITGAGATANPPVPRIPGLGLPINDFANGFAASFTQSSTSRQGYRTRSLNLFLQDDWRVRPNFTINAGLRWEYNTGLKEVRDQIPALRPGQQSTVFPDAPSGLVFVGDSGLTRSTYGEDLKNFGPRLGFAWNVLKSGKLSLRGGYGLFNDVVITEPTLQFLTSAPFAIRPLTSFTSYKDP
jgi:outer membrane receptor protein involved in Fe transport